jgi:type 2 lantibiotic biosynthesis protein LanM
MQELAFLRALKPWLEQACGRLHTCVLELQSSTAHLPFDPGTIEILCCTRLLGLLRLLVTRVMVLELHIARLQGKLQGETPARRFDFFFQQLMQPAQALALFADYPLLARQVSERTQGWLCCELELLERLCSDWDEIRQTFAAAGDPGILIQIREGEGDTHNGGRSVATLTWSSGLRLVYKPRAQTIDLRYQELLAWLNSQGCQPAFRLPRLLDKGQYGWCEYIAEDTCSSPAQIEHFYRRLGGHMALLYILEATDMHAQNLIAAGEHPMLIDLEALLHPRFPISDLPPDPVQALLDHSVLRIGLLPQRLFANQEQTGVDLSGLSARNGQLTPDRIAQLQAAGTDQMHITKAYIELEQGNHRPTLCAQEVDVLAQRNNLIAGFTTVYRLLLRHRNEVLARLLPRFADAEVRVLPRTTRLYASLLADSAHPDVLRDACEFERLLDRLWIGAGGQPHLIRLIPAERADLLQGDIPRFTARPASRDLFTSRGEILPSFLPEASLERARQRVQQLGARDLQRQTWIIEASFASLSQQPHLTDGHALPHCPAGRHVTCQELLEEARAVGDRLLKLALAQSGRVSWPGVSETHEREWRLLPAGPDLSNGLPGIALFLAYLGHLSGDKQYTRLARLTWRTIDARFCRKQHYLHWGAIGAFHGIGSFIYLLSHLGALWHSPALFQQAEAMAGHLTELIHADRTFDLVGGSAGCLAALLSLYAVAPGASTLAAALHCGDHLLTHARHMPQGIGWQARPSELPLTGMAHGNAGIALNLLRLADCSQQERFRLGALAAMDYERSLFLPEQNNWADLRGLCPPGPEEDLQACALRARPPMVAWCHGAAGIGLARLGSLPYHDDKATRAEIEAALQITHTQGFGTSHALCHGDMGNLETLLVASRVLPAQYPPHRLVPLQDTLLASMHTRRWCSCVPQGVETPGLLYGLAGTGYELLRLACPQQVPSLLLLAPPAAAAGSAF